MFEILPDSGVHLRNLRLNRRDPRLRDVHFSVRSREVLGLIGPNGSGKTTLFECLGGVLPADAGRVVAGERTLSERERAAFLFYLPDAIAPWPAQSVGWDLFPESNSVLRPPIAAKVGL